MIILVSDHGEEFYERGSWEHGKTLNAEILNVPLIIKFPSPKFSSPGGAGSGTISRPAQHVDLLPTVLETIGLNVPPSVEGRSLLRFLRTPGEDREPQRIFSYMKLDGLRGRSVIEGSWKFIQQWGKEWRNKRDYQLYLYHRRRDPGENVNLFDENLLRSGYLESLLKGHELRPRETIQPSKIIIDENLRKQLDALGYLQ